MSKGQSLQDPFLNALRRERIPVSIYLVNGIKLQGTVESFDQFPGQTLEPHPLAVGAGRGCFAAGAVARARGDADDIGDAGGPDQPTAEPAAHLGSGRGANPENGHHQALPHAGSDRRLQRH